MHPWEFTHCPWYLECKNWILAFDNTESEAIMKIAHDGTLDSYFVEKKLGPKEGKDKDVRAVKETARIELTHINCLWKPPKSLQRRLNQKGPAYHKEVSHIFVLIVKYSMYSKTIVTNDIY